MKLNKCQKTALSEILRWFHCSKEKNFILDGAGGTGKSTLINFVIKEFKNMEILILTPTHEALYQIREKIENRPNILFKTVAAGLGISPTTNLETLKFEHRAFPKFLEDIQLIIVDEASMITEIQLDLFNLLDIKILWVGHKSQLPPIESLNSENEPKQKGLGDLCLSPVFEKDFKSVLLKEPMRNKGELWKFTQLLEEKIYKNHNKTDYSFDVSISTIRKLVKTEEGKNLYRDGKLKTIVWRNREVILQTARIRKNLFGEIALEQKYLPDDLIILTSPTTIIENMEKYSDFEIKCFQKIETDTLCNNTKAKILEVDSCTIKLNRKLNIECFKLKIKTSYGEIFTIYEPKSKEDFISIGEYYKHIAWNQTSQPKKNAAFFDRHFILHCFANILHFYAATTYRLQGSSIEKVIVIAKDLDRIPNIVERAKHYYVACSRAQGEDGLMIYRG